MLRHLLRRGHTPRFLYGVALLGFATLAAAGALTAAGLFSSKTASASTSNPSRTAAAQLHLPAPQGHCAISEHSIRTRMRDGTMLEADVYQPATAQKVPVLLMRTQYDKASSEWNPLGFARPEYYAQHCYIVVVQDVRGQYKSRGNFYEFGNEQKDGYDNDTVQTVAKLPGADGRVGMWGVSYVGATQWLAAETAPPALKAIVPVNTASDYYNNWSYQDGAWSLAFEENWPANTIVQSRAEHLGNWRLATQIENDDQPAQLAKEYRFLPLDKFPSFHPNDPRVAKYFYDWIRHSTDDPYWKRWNPNTHYPDIKVPALDIDGWYDVFLDGALQNFTGMRAAGGSAFARANQQIVIGPYTHTNWSGLQPWGPAGAPTDRLDVSSPTNTNYGTTANLPINQLMLSFYDHYLKGINNNVQNEAAVRYFEMGANQWKSASGWPLPNTQWEKYYLTSGGHANSARGDGALSSSAPQKTTPADGYVYNPRNSVPSMGGHSCCNPNVDPEGPADQRAIERRSDVLVYTTPALQKPMEVTGPISVTLYAESSARDTDFTAKLVDVHPDGRAINLNDGVVVARSRNSVTHPSLIKPGKVYKYTINVWPTSNLFMTGHSIRLEVSSSNFPMYARNPNTGDRFGTDTYAQLKVARQTIYHSRQYPSEVTLPVIPATSASRSSAR